MRLHLGISVGPKTEIESITKDFAKYCKSNGWRVAFLQILPNFISVYKKLGFRVIKIGQEAVVDLNKFCTKTINTKELRRINKNFEEREFKIEIFEPPHSSDLLNKLKCIYNEWLSLPGKKEQKFCLGNFNKDYINETKIIGLHNSEGKLIAFVNLTPSYIKGHAIVDLMRHNKNMPNGAMDYLFIGLMKELCEQSYKELDMGMVAFSDIGEKKDSPFEEKAMKWASQKFSTLSFKGLKKYKSKFEPEWQNRYLAYIGGPMASVQIALAISKLIQ